LVILYIYAFIGFLLILRVLDPYPWFCWAELPSSESESFLFWATLNWKSACPNPGGGVPFAFIWLFFKLTSAPIEVKASGGLFKS